MRSIPVSSSLVFLGANVVVAAAAVAGVVGINVGFDLNLTGLSMLFLGYAAYHVGNMLFMRLFLRLFPMPAGPVVVGTFTDFIVGVYLLFNLFFVLPISGARILPAPFTSLWYRFLGAKIGKGSFPSGAILADPPFVELGDEVTLGFNSILAPHVRMGNFLKHGKITIGNRVTVGGNALIYGDTEIGDGALVLANSSVVPGTRIGENEMWGGNPAKKVKVLKPGDSAWNGAPQTAPQAWNGEKELEIARGV